VNARVQGLLVRLRALNAQRAAVALELAEALGSDPDGAIMKEPIVDVEPEPDEPRGRGRPMSERSRAILRFIRLRKRAQAGDFAFLGLTRAQAASTLSTLVAAGRLVRAGHAHFALAGAAESFAATLKQAVKATTKPKGGRQRGQLTGPQSASTTAIMALEGDITVERVMKMLNFTDKQARDKLVQLCNKRKALVRVGPATYRVGKWGGGETAPSK
jgi:hypothetical protein